MAHADIPTKADSGKKRYWISWYQPTEDYRPLSDPPNEHVLGWWCSGSRISDDAATLCAVVAGADEHEAKAAVKCDWPEATEWRFVEEKPSDFIPGDRFPVEGGWVKQRLLNSRSVL